MTTFVDSYRFAAAGAFVPTDVAGCVGWWDFSDTGSLTITSGKVATAPDLSGNGNDLTSTDASRRPVSTTTSSLGGGLAVAQFDAVDDLLRTAASPTAGTWTWVAAAVKRSTSSTGGNADVLITSEQRALYVSGSVLSIWTGSAEVTVSSTTSDWTNPNVFARSYASSTHNVWIDGSNVGGSPSGSTNSSIPLYLGAETDAGGGAGDWDIGEVVVYNTALGSTDRGNVEAYLATKWGI